MSGGSILCMEIKAESGTVKSLIFKVSSPLSNVIIETKRLPRLVRSLSTLLGLFAVIPVKRFVERPPFSNFFN